MFGMVANLNPNAGIVPATVHTLVGKEGSKPAFAEGGPNHQQVAEGKTARVGAARPGADGPEAITGLACLGYDCAAANLNRATVGILTAADTGGIVIPFCIDITAANHYVSAVGILAAANAGPVNATVSIYLAAGYVEGTSVSAFG